MCERIWIGLDHVPRPPARDQRRRQNTTTPLYKSMTIRSWTTTTKLLELMEASAVRSPPR
jgi:hypothetical protein